MTVTADPTIHSMMNELLARWPSAREPLTRHGMACVGCPMARFETLGEAAAAYGLEPRALLREIAAHARQPRPGRRAVL
jgi:hybrid cluster-associated redox disulfide protein